MSAFLASLKKEFLILSRDRAALFALFALPAIFIIIMSFALKDASSGAKNINCFYYISSENPSDLAQKFKNSMAEIQGFSCKQSDEKELKDADFLVVIPDNFFDEFGYDEGDFTAVKLLYQPTLNHAAIALFEAVVKEKIIMLYADDMGEHTPSFVTNLQKNFIQKIASSLKIPNSTEQSVPSWIVFAMFFIVFPFSTVLIIERDQGTYRRLKSVGMSIWSFFGAKAAAYGAVNILQGALLLCVGFFIIPLFGLEALGFGNFAAISALLVGISCAAIGFALFIAVVCKSSAQAIIAGGVSNILLGAIGGIMVPKYVMPHSMQQLSSLSPMSWGYDGFIGIFLYGAGLIQTLKYAAFLILFGMISFVISVYIFNVKRGD